LRTAGFALDDSSTDITRPCHEPFKESATILEGWQTFFKGHEENPKDSAKSGYRPGNEDQQDQPKYRITGIAGHFDVF